MFRKRTSLLLMLAALSQGCSATGDNRAPDHDWLESSASPAAIPSFEEFKRTASKNADGSGFIVETDMYFSTEKQLREYYDDIYVKPTEKSIINTVSNVRDLRANPRNIRYCFCSGWGQNQGTYQAPVLSFVRTALQRAMAEWEGVANVHFVYRSNLDGAKCTNSGANPGVDFVVQHWAQQLLAVGPFPSNPWSDQQLKIPSDGITRLLAIHELGHALGLRHEHIHSGATPRCAETDNHYEELTSFDTLSCMKYDDCTSNMAINNTEISVLDGVGLRIAYGPPDWWWSVLPSSATL